MSIVAKLLFFNIKFSNLLWRLMPIILATWEIEIRRIVVQGQPR
jgi:hypothetical protein